MAINTRGLALEVLVNTLEKNVYCNTALHECLNKNAPLDSKERAFLTVLVEGTVERCIELDYVIGLYSSKQVDKLKPYIRNILRMSVYQLLYMEQVPDSAAVNEAVKLAVKKGYAGLRGFVNGVLRNISRDSGNIKYPDKDNDLTGYLHIRYSMPKWLVIHFLGEMSQEDVIATLEYYMKSTDTVLRVVGGSSACDELTARFEDKDIRCNTGHIFDYVIRLNSSGSIKELPGYEEGRFVVQDESSMIPGHIALNWIRRQGASKVLDMCAAPGGKTLHIASEAGSKVIVDACDITEHKVKRIKDNVARLGLDNVHESIADALVYDDNKTEKYDVVIADLPCSGLGVLAGKSDIKYNASPYALNELAAIQRRMLDNASRYVISGGLLLYSTCTINRQENEMNADYFLEQNDDFEKCDIMKLLGDDMPEGLQRALTDKGYIQIIPGQAASDGFFIAAFRKK